MKPRIAEVRQIVGLLDGEHENVEDLAREVLVKAWQLADEREKWCVVVHDPGVGVFVHGPLGSRTEVERAVKRGDIVSAGNGPARGQIVRMVHV